MSAATRAADAWADNAFFVLELPATASRAEVERAGQKWLGMLELGLARAAIYATPLGARARTPELVRAAMAALRDPDKRIHHELWCLIHDAPSVIDGPDEVVVDDDAGFDALGLLHWSRR